MRVMSNTHDDLRLIQEVQKHPTLYDSRQRGYKDRPVKRSAWQAVADALDLQVPDAKNRWRYIRDRFVREQKLLLNDGEKVYQLKDPWPLLEDMSFIWDFITHRKPVSPSDAPGDSSPLDTVPNKKRKAKRALQPILPRPSPEWVNVTTTLDYDSAEGSTSNAGFSQEQKRIKQEPELNEGEPESQLRKLLEDRVSEIDELHPLEDDDMDDFPDKKQEESKDEDELYCLSVAAAFKRFSPKMKALAKWKIQQVLYDVEFNQPGPSNPQDSVVLPH